MANAQVHAVQAHQDRGGVGDTDVPPLRSTTKVKPLLSFVGGTEEQARDAPTVSAQESGTRVGNIQPEASPPHQVWRSRRAPATANSPRYGAVTGDTSAEAGRPKTLFPESGEPWLCGRLW